MKNSDRIIFPLDGMTMVEAFPWLTALEGKIGYAKVGLELFFGDGAYGGWGTVEGTQVHGHRVMLDLKLHDIPATMEGATKRAVAMEVDLLTVHASAGREAMARCVKATNGSKTKIVAVTVLTSLSENFMQRVWQPARAKANMIPNVVERLTEEAIEAGVDHFVCSPHEAGLIRAICDEADTIITPGIRLKDDDHDDQKRVDTPESAIANGADLLVVGRAIRNSKDPEATIKIICDEIEKGKVHRYDGPSAQ